MKITVVWTGGPCSLVQRSTDVSEVLTVSITTVMNLSDAGKLPQTIRRNKAEDSQPSSHYKHIYRSTRFVQKSRRISDR
jgi:hypothetical protein